jgi:HAD superfamily hydrolase (TIGR01509 family)
MTAFLTEPPALAIFDCDGVLVDSEPIAARCVAASITSHGWPITEDEVHAAFVGGTLAGIKTSMRAAGAELPDNWTETVYQELFAILAEEVEGVAGVANALDRLDASGVPYCVASNGPMRKMEITLGRTGLWDRLSHGVYSAHVVGVAKPDPGLFLHAAAAFETPPARAVVIEDSVTGVRAARAAGIPVLGYAAYGQAEALAEAGAHVFDNMAELPRLLAL